MSLEFGQPEEEDIGDNKSLYGESAYGDSDSEYADGNLGECDESVTAEEEEAAVSAQRSRKGKERAQ